MPSASVRRREILSVSVHRAVTVVPTLISVDLSGCSDTPNRRKKRSTRLTSFCMSSIVSVRRRRSSAKASVCSSTVVKEPSGFCLTSLTPFTPSFSIQRSRMSSQLLNLIGEGGAPMRAPVSFSNDGERPKSVMNWHVASLPVRPQRSVSSQKEAALCDIPWMRAARYMPHIGIAWKAFAISATSMNMVLPFLRASAMTETTTAPVPAGSLSGVKPVWSLLWVSRSCQTAEVSTDMLRDASFRMTSRRQIWRAPSSVPPRGPLLPIGYM